MRAILAVCLMAALCPAVSAQGLRERVITWARKYEVRPGAKPDWAAPDTRPRFSFVVIADIHLGDEDRILSKAMAATNGLKPSFVLILGDNIDRPTVAEHRRLKGLLDRGLRPPYHIIKGDNDARNYTRVFGSTNWSFVFGGVHFLATGLDVDVEGEGVGRLDPQTHRWLGGRLRAHSRRPTVFLMHESIVPPSFLGAPLLAALLARRKQVVGILNGHLHLDLELRLGRRPVLGIPGLGPNPKHGFKQFLVHPDRILIRTFELGESGYAAANKWQRIAFPEGLRPAADAPLVVTARTTMPARETRFDPQFARRFAEIEKRLNRVLSTFDRHRRGSGDRKR